MSSEPTATAPGGTGASGRGRPLTWRDVQGETRRHADELICTEAEAAALHALRTATEETDGDMERHTVRQYLIAERLADTGGVAYDRELLLCASFLHDAGLYGPASTGTSTSRTPRATPVERLNRSVGRRSACDSASTPASSTTPSPRDGRWGMRSSSSAAPTSSR